MTETHAQAVNKLQMQLDSGDAAQRQNAKAAINSAKTTRYIK